MSDTGLLPEGFEALEPFVGQWVADNANARLQRRLGSSDEERTAFFTAGSPLVPAALALLDSKPLPALDAREDRLMQLVLSLAHVANAVEIQKEDEPKHAVGARYITITRASADDNP